MLTGCSETDTQALLVKNATIKKKRMQQLWDYFADIFQHVYLFSVCFMSGLC